MKKLLTLVILFLLSTVAAHAQSQTTFTVTVVAPPTCTVKLLPNPVSSGGASLYSGQAGVINFDISGCASASASATATWDGASLPTVFKSGPPASLNTPISAAQATAGSHTLILSIPLPILSMNAPVLLPNAKMGQPYNVDLASLTQLSGGTAPYSFTLTSTLPAGLSLSSAGVVTGVPSSTGLVSFNFTVKDSSGTANTFRRAILA